MNQTRDATNRLGNKPDFEVAAILQTFYWNEINVRVENDLETGFYASLTVNWSRTIFNPEETTILVETDDLRERLLNDNPLDWRSRCVAQTCEEAVNKLFWQEADENPELLEDLLKNQAPLLRKAHEIKLGATLQGLHNSGILFRISCDWDLGFDLYTINREVKPARVQVDNHNERLINALKTGEKRKGELLAIPSKDWLVKTGDLYTMEEINNWFLSLSST